MSWLSGWRNRYILTIDSSKVDENLYDFPVYVELSSSTGQGSDDATPIFDELASDDLRKRIAITTLSGSTETECYVEIEDWDDASEKAYLWVKVPTVYSGIDTLLYLYYDASHSDNTAYIGDSGDAVSQNVWDDNFVGVWHLAQDPSGGSDAIKDSTSNNNDGTSVGSMTSGDLVDGYTGKGLNFDGSNDSINCGNSSVFNITNNLTMEAWAKPHDFSSETYQKIAIKNAPTNTMVYQVQTGSTAGTTSPVYFNVRTPGGTDTVDTNGSISEGSYRYFAGTFDSGTMKFFLDGSETDSKLDAGATINTSSDDFSIGDEDTNVNAFDGEICEVRVSNTVRSDAWIKATRYSSDNNLITFSTYSGYFDGYVYELGTPVIRALNLHNRLNGYLMNSTTSSGNGYYYLETTYSGSHYIVCLDDAAGEDYNDLIIGNVYPTTISG